MSPFQIAKVHNPYLTKTAFRAAVRKVRAIEAEDGHYLLASTSTAGKLAVNWNFL